MNTEKDQKEQLHQTAVINSALITMTDFVLREQENIMYDSFNRCTRYADFLKQPLHLGMFIQDEDQDTLFINCKLVEPKEHEIETLNGTIFLQYENFVIGHLKDWESDFDFYFDSIEEIINDMKDYDLCLKLTDSAIKHIFG